MTPAPIIPDDERSITSILRDDFGITHRGRGTAHELFGRAGESLGHFTARGACDLIERLRAAPLAEAA